MTEYTTNPYGELHAITYRRLRIVDSQSILGDYHDLEFGTHHLMFQPSVGTLVQHKRWVKKDVHNKKTGLMFRVRCLKLGHFTFLWHHDLIGPDS